jgi:hypothetical protein
MICYLQIAGLQFQICSPSQLQLPDCFQPFVRQESQADPDITIHLFPIPENFRIDGQQMKENVYLSDESVIQRCSWGENQYIVRVEPADRGEPCQLGIPEQYFDEFCTNGNWLPSMMLERLMLPHGRIFLHAAAVIWKNKAYLFVAPSGGGKSTQAALWESQGAEILNGDKVILAREKDEWMAYGGPVAGSSQIYKDKHAALAAIMLVRKKTHNQLIRMSPREAFLNLYSNAIKSNWDQEYNCRLLDMIEPIAKQIPIYYLDCTPEPCAVDYVHSKLKG